MQYGFIKTEAVSPDLRAADCRYNTEKIIEAMKAAAERGSQLVVFPELAVTGCTCGDLFLQKSLQTAAHRSLTEIMDASRDLNLVTVVGLPVASDGRLYNCAAVVCKGEVLGIVPKQHLSTICGIPESRWFTPGPAEDTTITVDALDDWITFSSRIRFRLRYVSDFTLAVEIGSDVLAPSAPSVTQVMEDGISIIACPAAWTESSGSSAARRRMIAAHSEKLVCGYVMASAGPGESSTDASFGGHCLIAENGCILAESLPFEEGLCTSEIDVQLIHAERQKNPLFGGPASPGAEDRMPEMLCWIDPVDNKLTRSYPSDPFMPHTGAARDEACEEILRIQAAGLKKRMEHTHSQAAVIGISGGLDSCLALLAAVRAMEKMGRPASDVHAITMPCFGTSRRTRSNAEILCEELGVQFEEISIRETVLQHFKDIGQPADKLDVTFENAQARVRTLVLMDRANQVNGLVIGTGDLSELALGWATYNGDHMSMYALNGGIPKTLVRHLVRYEAERFAADGRQKLSDCLIDILETPVSPELLPTKDSGEIAQETESIIGPYEIHDFYIYYILRYGFSPKKVFKIAQKALGDKYSDEVLVYWLRNFYRRFFAQQFKRSCLPDGPKVGEISLSPRGGLVMPSDALNTVWMEEVAEIEKKLGL